MNEPLKKYSRLYGTDGYLTTHETNNYHKENALKASDFQRMTPEQHIDSQLSKHRASQSAKNRKVLSSVIRAILVCGKSGTALRGHRDHGRILDVPDCNDGIFREILRALVDVGDSTLEEHLRYSAQNAQYTSWRIQNELIEGIGSVVLDTLRERISRSKFVSILADETTDTARKEQMTICLRYVPDGDATIFEDFLHFTVAEDLTGEGLGQQIEQEVLNLGIELKGRLVGLGFDGASSMSGKFRGAQAVIRRRYPEAVYVHCSAHCLNLVISKSSEVPAIRNTWGIVRELGVFLTSSSSRVKLLEDTVKEHQGDTGIRRVKVLCDTRWVERHDAIATIAHLLPSVDRTLSHLQSSAGPEASHKAKTLSCAIDAEFIVSLYTLKMTLSITKGLSEALQKIAMDLFQAKSLICSVIEELQHWRSDENHTRFNELWCAIETMAVELNIDLSPPRRAVRQQHRVNIPCSDAKEYWRLSVFYPFLDSLLTNFRDRFEHLISIVAGFTAIMPRHCNQHQFSDLAQTVNHFAQYLPSHEVEDVEAEFRLWCRMWAKETVPPLTLTDALKACDYRCFPCLNSLLLIYATLPVSTSTGERSFSTLKHLKSYLRTTMGEERLNGLALMYIHKNVLSDTAKVISSTIDKFLAVDKNRRATF